MIDLVIDQSEIERSLKYLQGFEKEAKAAVYQSVKRTMTSVRTAIAKEIRQVSTLKASVVQSSIGKVSIFDKGSLLEGQVLVNSRPMELIDYQISPRRITAQKGKRPSKWRPVRWRIEKGKAFKANRREDGFSKAFVASAKNGRMFVFRRKGKQLHVQYAPRTQYFMAFEKLQNKLMLLSKERFEKTLKHEINYRLGKLGAK